MAVRLSRRKLAHHVVAKLQNGTSVHDTLKELAAYLTESRRTREYELIIRDIEDVLAQRGTIIADVISARPLSDTTRKDIKAIIGAKDVLLRETVDETVLGGLRIDTPGQRYDGTVRHKLNALKTKQL